MRRRKSKTDYRIVGARGEWFAWRQYGRLKGWHPHVRRITVFAGKRMRGVTAVQGRTPSEALERLKRIERRAC